MTDTKPAPSLDDRLKMLKTKVADRLDISLMRHEAMAKQGASLSVTQFHELDAMEVNGLCTALRVLCAGSPDFTADFTSPEWRAKHRSIG